MLDNSDKIKINPKFFEFEQIKLSLLINYISQKNKNLFYFSNPASDFEVLAFGKRFSLQANYPDIKNIYNLLLNKIEIRLSDIQINNLPLIFGYHKFPSSNHNQLWIDYQVSEWILPSIIFFRRNHNCWLIDISDDNEGVKLSSRLNEIIQNDNSLSNNSLKLNPINLDLYDDWTEKVSSAINKIKTKQLEKIVLARRKEFEIQGALNFSSLIEILNDDYKDCLNFLVKSDESFFFGSSPELLVKVNDNQFKSEALAGSIQRGKSDNEDESLSQLLLIDRKNLSEHQIVIDYLKSNLNDKITDFKLELKPKIKRLKNIQHLHTEISGIIKEDNNYFDLVESIFPTPAVCGIPTEAAISVLNDLEEFERGLFTGLIGWLNFNNQAEFYVAIRCGLVKNNTLNLFAGCGIVENSNAHDEFNETELKFKTITDLFNVES